RAAPLLRLLGLALLELPGAGPAALVLLALAAVAAALLRGGGSLGSGAVLRAADIPAGRGRWLGLGLGLDRCREGSRNGRAPALDLVPDLRIHGVLAIVLGPGAGLDDRLGLGHFAGDALAGVPLRAALLLALGLVPRREPALLGLLAPPPLGLSLCPGL